MRRESNTATESAGDGVSDTEGMQESNLEQELESKQSSDGPSFNPALYIQRYLLVADTVVELCDQSMKEDHSEFKILDLGCANCSLFVYLKNALSEKTISVSYIAVDKDRTTLLMDAKSAVEPGIWDYTKQRSGPISVQVLEGDILQPDPRLANADVLIMVEVIEHIPIDIVETTFAEVIFGHIRPRAALLTTPNFEFNVLFPDFQAGKCNFRHWDHKFEWTREEFETWCTRAAERFGYRVTFLGIGSPPPDRTDVGCCSQMAHFTRIDDSEAELSNFVGEYETIQTFDYLWKKPPTPMERLTQNIRLALVYHARSAEQEVDSDYDTRNSTDEFDASCHEHRPSFPINALSSFIEHMDEEKGLELIRNIAVDAGFQLSQDRQHIICPNLDDEDADVDDDEEDEVAEDTDVAQEAETPAPTEHQDGEATAWPVMDNFDDWNWDD